MTDKIRVGCCGSCGGDVMSPSGAWFGERPKTCKQCGRHAISVSEKYYLMSDYAPETNFCITTSDSTAPPVIPDQPAPTRRSTL